MYDSGRMTWLDDKIEKRVATIVERYMAAATLTRAQEPVVRIENDANNNPVYVGEAPPGVTTNKIGWRIKKITYDASNNPLQIEWAEGSDAYIYVWDRRADYNYS